MNYLVVYYDHLQGADKVGVARDWNDTPDMIAERMDENCLIGEPGAVHAIISVGTVPPEGLRYIETSGFVAVNCGYGGEELIPVLDLDERP